MPSAACAGGAAALQISSRSRSRPHWVSLLWLPDTRLICCDLQFGSNNLDPSPRSLTLLTLLFRQWEKARGRSETEGSPGSLSFSARRCVCVSQQLVRHNTSEDCTKASFQGQPQEFFITVCRLWPFPNTNMSFDAFGEPTAEGSSWFHQDRQMSRWDASQCWLVSVGRWSKFLWSDDLREIRLSFKDPTEPNYASETSFSFFFMKFRSILKNTNSQLPVIGPYDHKWRMHIVE